MKRLVHPLFGCLLAVLLLIAQQGALLHALGHVMAGTGAYTSGDVGGAQHGVQNTRSCVHGGAGCTVPQSDAAHIACAVCLAYAGCAAVLVATLPALALLPAQHRYPSNFEPGHRATFRAAYRARAPPSAAFDLHA